MTLIWILGSTILVSLISLIGVVTFAINEKLLRNILFLLVGFSAGALIGGAFLHLLPEALEQTDTHQVFMYLLAGFMLFFVMERYFHWRHCHEEGHCKVHAFTYLNLIGDGIHNFMDGIIIAVSFVVSIKLGIVTTLAVIFHEIPQELGDFGVLIYGGFTKSKALFYNFLSALTAVVGAVVGYALASKIADMSSPLMAITAGGFIYIAASDLIPELHKVPEMRRANLAFLSFVFGVVFMWGAAFIRAH